MDRLESVIQSQFIDLFEINPHQCLQITEKEVH